MEKKENSMNESTETQFNARKKTMRDHLFYFLLLLLLLLQRILFQNGFDDFYLWLIYFVFKKCFESWNLKWRRKQWEKPEAVNFQLNVNLLSSFTKWFPTSVVNFMMNVNNNKFIDRLCSFHLFSSLPSTQTGIEGKSWWWRKKFFNYKERWFIASATTESTIEIKLISKCIIWRLNERHECGTKAHFPSIVRLPAFYPRNRPSTQLVIIGFNWTIGS